MIELKIRRFRRIVKECVNDYFEDELVGRCVRFGFFGGLLSAGLFCIFFLTIVVLFV